MTRYAKNMLITARQCRAARVGVDMSRGELAALAGVAERTIIDFEREAREPIQATKAAIRTGLEKAGVRFTDEGCICLPEKS
jgi:DNA-binding XRE family transcriptional regulator